MYSGLHRQISRTHNVNIRRITSLPSPAQLKADLPITKACWQTVLEGRKTINNIIHGTDPRLLVAMGPCSIHNPKEALQYARWLKGFRDRLNAAGSNIYIVMRAVFVKPRTNHDWTGYFNDPDMNAAHEAARGEKEPFVVFGPGEYEISDVAIAGFATKSTYGLPAQAGGKERINTVYALTFDGMSLLYLGALESSTLPADVLEMDAPDVLFVPIGGEGTLGPSDAQKLAVKLEAKIVIPILYNEKTLKQFLKEAGEESVKPVDKLTIKRRDIADKEGDVVVLSS